MPRPDADTDARTCVQNGVAVPTGSPEEGRDYRPTYETPVVEWLRERVRPGDDAVVVGGGLGVTTVVAARMTHYEGTVTTYEPSEELVEALHNTLTVNRVDDLVSVEHAAVGPVHDRSKDLFGPSGGAERVEPDDLPDCDVLELDCEGAELAILRALPEATAPDTVVVETHPHLGVTEDAVREALDGSGYRVEERATAGVQGDLPALLAVPE